MANKNKDDKRTGSGDTGKGSPPPPDAQAPGRPENPGRPDGQPREKYRVVGTDILHDHKTYRAGEIISLLTKDAAALNRYLEKI